MYVCVYVFMVCHLSIPTDLHVLQYTPRHKIVMRIHIVSVRSVARAMLVVLGVTERVYLTFLREGRQRSQYLNR